MGIDRKLKLAGDITNTASASWGRSATRIISVIGVVNLVILEFIAGRTVGTKIKKIKSQMQRKKNKFNTLLYFQKFSGNKITTGIIW